MEKFENIIDKNILGTNMMFISLFVTVYENFCDVFQGHVKNFLCYDNFENGKMVTVETEEYKTEIKNRIIDGKYKDKLKATILWFVDSKAITQEDYEMFLKIKEKRNIYVHQMFEQLANGITEADFQLFIELKLLYKKLDMWWINEMEVPIVRDVGGDIQEDYDRNGVASGSTIMLDIMFEVLFLNKSSEYKEMYEKVKSGKI